jgi:hypothetical protein
MKALLKIIAWTGAGLIAVAVIWSFLLPVFSPQYEHDVPMMPFAWVLIILFDIVGLPLILIGGWIIKPHHFGFACIIIGSLYLASFYWLVPTAINIVNQGGMVFSSIGLFIGMAIIPGLLILFEGVILKVIEKHRQRRGIQ